MKDLVALVTVMVLLAAAPLFYGCGGKDEVPCSKTAAVVTPVVTFVASKVAMDCSNTVLMTTDFEQFIGSLGLCKLDEAKLREWQRIQELTEEFNRAGEKGRGIIGNTLCPLLVQWGVSQFVNNRPRLIEWGCKGTGMETALKVACGFVPI